MKFSVIVPTYDNAETIVKCINSVLNQSYHDFEVIIVDDGSKDNTGEILKLFADIDKVSIFHQSNKGVSNARNRGIDFARGDYFCFIDADDFLGKDYLFNFYKQLSMHPEVKMISSAAMTGFKKDWRIQGSPKNRHVKIEKFIELMALDESIYSFLWNKTFSREIIEKNYIRFDESIYYGEDFLFLAQYIVEIDEAITTANIDYNYSNRPNNITNRVDEEKLQKKLTYLRAIDESIQIVNKNGYKAVPFYIKFYSEIARQYRTNYMLNKHKDILKQIKDHINLKWLLMNFWRMPIKNFSVFIISMLAPKMLYKMEERNGK